MNDTKTHRVVDRNVSLSRHWVRPIVRGKQNADVEFGAKVEMSVVNGYLRVEDRRWDAFNENTILQESAEVNRRACGHYPARILADTIFRTRENLRYCKEHASHMMVHVWGESHRRQKSTVRMQAEMVWSGRARRDRTRLWRG